MIVESPAPKMLEIEDLDFTFTNGIFMPISIDKGSGDMVEYPTPDTLVIHLASKPSVTDPKVMLPAEDVTIYVRNILTIQHRVRLVTELTTEQKMEWQKTLAGAGGKSIN